METIEKKETTLVYDAKSLNDLAKGFCKDAQTLIKEREYQISDESKESLERMIKFNWTSIFGNMSKNRRKKFNKYLRRFNKRKSLHSMNLFFHFLYNKVLTLGDVDKKEVKENWWTRTIITPKDFKKVKISPSKKHLLIQEKKKKWKEAQAISEKLLLEYKTEKGDYYKLN